MCCNYPRNKLKPPRILGKNHVTEERVGAAAARVDTTAQTKSIRFPTDARLYNRCRERLVKTACRQGLAIKQSYQHTGKKLLLDASRHAHAWQGTGSPHRCTVQRVHLR